MDSVVEALPAASIALERPTEVLVDRRLPLAELFLAIAYVIACLVICRLSGIPVSLPSSRSLDFTGMSYLVPILVFIAGIVIIVVTKRSAHLVYLATVLLAYFVILIAHFNVKLGIHMINPASWDAAFWQVDQTFRPVVDGARAAHNALARAFGPMDWLYLFAFLAMFVSSIFTHASRSIAVLRKFVIASMLVHMLGGLSYLIAPALGPFIYETGVNALEAQRQTYMLAAHHASLAGGAAWFEAHGPSHLATGLAAMPSLHVASSGVFVYFAWQHERYLTWFYAPLFVFIMIEAVASRWHYLIDIPAGLALTVIAVGAAEYCVPRQHQ
jgi:hypothetical protein